MSVAHIVEVGLRDGLQNEKSDLSLKDRYQIVKKLSLAGLKRIELGSFVSPKAVPQMRCVPELTKKVLKAQNMKALPRSVQYSVFVPNLKGFEKAVECDLKEISFFVSCTESFSKKNINMNIQESLKILNIICLRARRLKIKVRVYLSVAFACPYEGKVRPSKAVTLADCIMQEEVFELSISDTIGIATPVDVLNLMNLLQNKVPVNKVALHFHNTHGMALANVKAGLQSGVRIFDSSIGGLGGCPYAPGASGNVATEDLAYVLEKMKITQSITKQNGSCFSSAKISPFKFKPIQLQKGIKIQELIKTTRWLEKKLNHSLPASVKFFP